MKDDSEALIGSGDASSGTQFSLPVSECERWPLVHEGLEHEVHADAIGLNFSFFVALRGVLARGPSDDIPAGTVG